MNAISVATVLSLYLAVALLYMIVAGWRRLHIPIQTKSMLVAIAFLILYRSISNYLRWNGIGLFLEALENYLEIMIPIFWLFFIISYSQYRTMKDVAESEERNRMLSSITSDFTYMIEVGQKFEHAFFHTWGKYGETTGYFNEKMTRDFFYQEIVHPEDLSMVIKSFNRNLENHFETIQFRIRHKSGKLLWIEDVRAPRYDRALKRVTRIFGAVKDITELRENQQELRDTRNRLERAQAMANVGTWELDLVTNEIWESNELRRIFGIDPNDKTPLLSNMINEYIHPEDRPRVEAGLADLQEQGKTRTQRYRFYRKGEDKIRTGFSSTEIITNEMGLPIKAIGTLQDITEMSQLEAQYYQSQKMEAIGQFAGGVAHDINNLMTAITGHGELARIIMKSNDAEKISTHLDEILKAAEKAGSLNKRLLGFSRKKSADLKHVNLNNVIHDFVRMIDRIISEDIILDVQLGDESNVAVADVSYVEQLVMNLIVNARDAMPRGGRLTVRTQHRNVNQEYSIANDDPFSGEFSIIEVSDTGSGIPAREISKIFEPFYTTKSEERGTGLGLATVLGVVKQMEGFIQVESEIDKGSTFRIFLPAAREQEIQSSKPIPTLTYPRGTETVLIVEDDDIVLKLAADALINHGYKIHTARNGEEALQLIEKTSGQIDLVLTDVVMPSLRGPEMVEQLQKFHPEIKVLYMSGYAAKASEMIGQDDAFMQKPFTIHQLTNSIRNLLDGVPQDKIQ